MAKLDVVIPVFNEIEIVDQLHARVLTACKATDLDFEIIYVDDGSRDETGKWIREHVIAEGGVDSATKHCKGQSVTLIQLSKNFGQPAAILAGLRSSTGDCVVVIDGDLQDPPELLPELVNSWQAGNDVVIARRTSRKESLLRGLAFRVFHKCFRYLADTDIPPNTGTFCLMDRQAVNAMCDFPESHRFFPGLRSWIGFQQSMVMFDRQERAGGQPKQTFVRLFRYALDAIFGFSFKPLRLLTGAGALVCMVSFVFASWFVCKRLVGWETASIGFTTLTCAVFGLGGFQLIGMGILGEYIGRIYDEVKGRPQFVVSREFRSGKEHLGRSRIREARTSPKGKQIQEALRRAS